MRVKEKWHIGIAPIVGIGCWVDNYIGTLGPNCYAVNIILPFVRIQYIYLEVHT